MGKCNRNPSKLDVYHLVFKGANKQTIFEDFNDHTYFLALLSYNKFVEDFEIHAYCLMSNHAHVLIKADHEKVSRIAQKISGPYARWYNFKHNRTGPLFDGRYRRVPIDCIPYYKNTVRYIHQNPVRANLIGSSLAMRYPFSSYHEFIYKNVLCDTQSVLDYFSSKNGLDALIDFHDEMSDPKDFIFDYDRITESEARKIIVELLGTEDIKEINRMDKKMRNEKILIILNEGIGQRQLARLTGISRNVIKGINHP